MQKYFEKLFSLKGKVALITGGGSGLGSYIAKATAQAGARVYIVSRKQDNLARVSREITDMGGLCHSIVADLSTQDGIDGLVNEITQVEPEIDILVNNAGATWGAPMGQFPWSAWQKVMDLNVASGFQLTQAMLPLLTSAASADSPARILFVGSVTGSRAIAQNAYSYASSKAAVHHLTKILANELAGKQITVNAIAPGPFHTRMTDYVHKDEALQDEARSYVPLDRFGSELDIAGTVLPLLSRAGNYVTGAIVPVDGGISAMP